MLTITSASDKRATSSGSTPKSTIPPLDVDVDMSPVDAASEETGLSGKRSEYEKEKEVNIARNKELLASMGLNKTTAELLGTSKKAKMKRNR